MKDAGAAFDRKVKIIVVDEFDARQGNFSPCLYRILKDKKHPLAIWRHGDDFAVSCRRSDAKWFGKGLGKHLIVKNRGILGPRPEEGDVCEIIVLNRILRCCASIGGTVGRIEWEADPRHTTDIVIARLGKWTRRASPWRRRASAKQRRERPATSSSRARTW